MVLGHLLFQDVLGHVVLGHVVLGYDVLGQDGSWSSPLPRCSPTSSKKHYTNSLPPRVRTNILLRFIIGYSVKTLQILQLLNFLLFSDQQKISHKPINANFKKHVFFVRIF